MRIHARNELLVRHVDRPREYRREFDLVDESVVVVRISVGRFERADDAVSELEAVIL